MAKSKTLADLIGTGLAEATRRQTWWDFLAPDAQAQLLQVRTQYQGGEYGPKVRSLTVARMLVERCEERGWKVCDPKRLSEWLRQKS